MFYLREKRQGTAGPAAGEGGLTMLDKYWDVTILVQVRAPDRLSATNGAMQILAQTEKAAVINKTVLRCVENKEEADD